MANGRGPISPAGILVCMICLMVPAPFATKAALGENAGMTKSALSTSDETAEALLSAMKARNYVAAFEMFDATMRDAISEERLGTVWKTQTDVLGPLVSWAITQRTQAQGRDIRIATLKFANGELQATVAINPQKQDVGGFVIRPMPKPTKPAPPAAYVDPSKFRAVELPVGEAPCVLGGTLTLPTVLDPVPGIVLVHGSGPNDRDETIGGNKIFKDLAEGLASRGIAVLRYDKRTFVYGAKTGDSISVDDEVIKDAVAAVHALRARPEIDPQRIFVIGHSMGAQIAPEIATRSAPIAGIVLLAPPGRAPWDLVLSQMRYLNSPAKEVAEVERKVTLLKVGNLGDEKLLGVGQSYWRDLAAHDGIGMTRKLGKPALILRGDRDYQVIEEDLEAWRKGLADVPNVQIVTMTGVNHLFIVGSGNPGPAEYDIPGHVDSRVIDRLAAFISTGNLNEPSRKPSGANK